MWNPHLGEKLYIGTFPHLSWFHRPLPTLSHNCSISLQWLQLLLTCQILKRLWLSLNWRRCHCLVRQGPRAHWDPPLKPCFLPIIPKCTFLLILLGPVKKMGPNHYPLEVYFFSYIDIFLTFNRCDCIACLAQRMSDDLKIHQHLDEAKTWTPTHFTSQDVPKTSQHYLSCMAGSLCTSLYVPVALTWEGDIRVERFKPSKLGTRNISQTQMDTCWWVQESR